MGGFDPISWAVVKKRKPAEAQCTGHLRTAARPRDGWTGNMLSSANYAAALFEIICSGAVWADDGPAATTQPRPRYSQLSSNDWGPSRTAADLLTEEDVTVEPFPMCQKAAICSACGQHPLPAGVAIWSPK